MTEHSTKIGGSSAARVINCPGSWGLTRRLPRRTGPNVYADEGSMLHAAMTEILEQGIDPHNEPGAILGFHSHGHTLTEDLFVEMILPAWDTFMSIGLDEFICEQRVDIPELEGEFGTADIQGARYHSDTIADVEFAAVVDFKFGRGVEVDPMGYGVGADIGNAQLRYYGVGSRAQSAGWFEGNPEIRLYIIQPAFKRNDIYDVVTNETLDEFHAVLKRTTRIMQKPNAPFAIGPWCAFCDAEPACPLKNRKAQQALNTVVDGALTAKKLGKLAEMADELEPWIKSVRALTQEQLEAGHPVPGWKIVAKAAQRRCSDPEAAEQAIRRARLPLSKIFERKLLGVTGLEKLKRQLTDKQWAKLQDIIAEHFPAKSSGTTLAREDDDRPAVMTGAAALAALRDKMSS